MGKDYATPKVSKKHIMVLFIGILIIGILLAIIDFDSAAIFFTYVPIFIIVILFSWGNVVLFAFSMYFFGAIAIGGVLFWFNRNNYWANGMMGIGKFDFSYSSFLEMNSYLLVYFFVIFGWLYYWGRRFKVYTGWNLLREKSSRNNRNKKIVTMVWGMTILQIIMYNYGIAIHGVSPRELPFHLWGGYWYFRMFISPILLYFILENNESTVCWISILIYIYVISVCSLSRSTIILSSIPMILFLKNKKWYRVLLYFYFILLCIYISDLLRPSIYMSAMSGQVNLFVQTVGKSLSLMTPEQYIKAPLNVMITITGRMGGNYSIVQAGQSRTIFKLDDFVNYQLTARLPDLSYNKLEEIVCMEQIYGGYDGISVGYGLSYLGCIILTSQYYYFATVVHAIIVALPISLLYLLLWDMHRLKYYKAEMMANILFSLMFMFFLFGGFNGVSVLQLYEAMIICFVAYGAGRLFYSKLLGGNKIFNEA